MSGDKDELIRAQNQVIGILFEIVKRLSENSTLDEEYFSLVQSGKSGERLDYIISKRRENSQVVARLLSQLES